MGDRTYGALTVTACPPEHVEAVIAVINDYGLHPSNIIERYGFNGVDDLILGELYSDNEVSCGWTTDADAALCDLDGVAYMMSEDPKYEWLGDVYYRLADGRQHSGPSDADQNIVLTAPLYTALLDNSEADLLAFARAVIAHFNSTVVSEWHAERDRLLDVPVAERTLTAPEEDA